MPWVLLQGLPGCVDVVGWLVEATLLLGARVVRVQQSGAKHETYSCPWRHLMTTSLGYNWIISHCHLLCRWVLPLVEE